MRNCLAQLVVVDENELQSLSEFVCGQKLQGISMCSNGKQNQNLKLLRYFEKKKRSSARGNSEEQVLKLGRRNTDTTCGMLGVTAIL